MWIQCSRSSFIGNPRVFTKILWLPVRQELFLTNVGYYFPIKLHILFYTIKLHIWFCPMKLHIWFCPFHIGSVRLQLLVVIGYKWNTRGPVPCMGNTRPLSNINVGVLIRVQGRCWVHCHQCLRFCCIHLHHKLECPTVLAPPLVPVVPLHPVLPLSCDSSHMIWKIKK